MRYYHYENAFELENGTTLDGLSIAYHTYGEMNGSKSNVVWICHHLTANSDAALWWKGMIGEGLLIDPSRYFIVCANILGSCYGTTGPLSINPSTGQPWYAAFPQITIRDMVRAHMLLRAHLQITSIQLLIGGSMGGYQALEWCLMEQGIAERLILLSTSAAESAWGIAVHTAQRLAIEADASWKDSSPEAGKKGLKAARAMGLISYRNHGILVKKQTDPDVNKTDHFRSSSYIEYQGEKLVNRFNAFSYWILTKSMDSHNLARGRQMHITEVLGKIQQPTLVFGIYSDILCPLAEQQFLVSNMPNASLSVIDSAYGHDGFMVEAALISLEIENWLNN